MGTWLGLRRRRQAAGEEPSQGHEQEEQEQQELNQEEESSEEERRPSASAAALPTPSRTRRVLRTLRRWLLGALSLLGLFALALAVLVARADLRAVRVGRPPTWASYRAGLRLLELLEATRDTLTPPDLRALEMSYAFIDTAIVHQMTALGALDAFPHGAVGRGRDMCLRAEEVALAAPTVAHAPFLYRLLRAAATRGLLEWHAEPDDCFSITTLGTRFQRGGPFYAQARWNDGWTINTFFEGLGTGLRTGELPFSAARHSNDSFWAHLQKDPCRRTLFDAALAAMTQHAAPALAEALDEAIAAADAHHAVTMAGNTAPSAVWPPPLVRPGKCVCDIGGGGGGGKGASPLLAAVLARHPGIKGVVYDLAEAARDDALPLSSLEEETADVEALEAEAEAAVTLGGMSPLFEGLSLWPGLGKRGTSLADARRRIRRVSGSFLDRGEVLAKLSGGRCDVFILKHILHDWGDDICVAILSHLREALLSSPRTADGPHHGGRVVVMEQVIGGVREGQRPGPCNASGSSHHGAAGRTVIYDRMAAAMDINMLCMVGEGRERTEAEFRAVFATAGFRLVHAAPTKSPMAVMVLEPCEKHP